MSYRPEWMKGICHKWSRGRHFSPSLPGDRYLKLGSKSDLRAEILGSIVGYDALAPRPEVLLLWKLNELDIYLMRKRKFDRTGWFVIVASRNEIIYHIVVIINIREFSVSDLMQYSKKVQCIEFFKLTMRILVQNSGMRVSASAHAPFSLMKYRCLQTLGGVLYGGNIWN